MSDSAGAGRHSPFSQRFQNLDRGLTPLARLRAEMSGVLDLTVSDPTRVGLAYPDEAIRRCLTDALAGPYEPAPLGLDTARQAVAGYYRKRGSQPDPDRIAITASTSEAYSFLFKLLADPGDEILVPSPSYPLFDFLALAEGVRVVPYPIHDAGGWQIDVGALADSVSDSSRAIVLVHPNNPTGHCLRAEQWSSVQEIARRRGLAVIVDEVFFDFPLAECGARLDAAAAECPALTFVLNGLSKTAGLPQLKLGWMLCRGPDAVVREALDRLEVVADTFLSVATPVQRALPGLLELAPRIRAGIQERLCANLERLRASGLDDRPVEGGWSAPIRVPSSRTAEEWALDWLQTHGVLTHPGELFGFAAPHLVVSLLTEPETLDEALLRIGPGQQRTANSE